MARPPSIEFRSSSASTGASWNWDMAHCEMLVRCDAVTLETTAIHLDGSVVRRWEDPLEALRWLAAFDLSDFPYGPARWSGYLGYDVGRLFEAIPRRVKDDLGIPLFAFALSSADRGCRVTPTSLETNSPGRIVESTFTRDTYERAVGRALDYIAAGDVFQVNLSQRFTCASGRPAKQIFQQLHERGGAQHGALLDFGDFALISDSPELFLKVTRDPDSQQRRVITRPIKGTRARQPGMDIALRDSVKDQAELNMIVDLERNDLGRVCEIGSVRVTQPRAIEAHPTVYHGVATVQGTLRNDVTFVDLLRATFPGGSITGAPKIRAMEIIDELEPVRRGPYCGAIGYIAADGSMEFNIAIRTMVAKDRVVYVPVGGGIVADSDPAAEYEETLVKAQAMFAALGIENP